MVEQIIPMVTAVDGLITVSVKLWAFRSRKLRKRKEAAAQQRKPIRRLRPALVC